MAREIKLRKKFIENLKIPNWDITLRKYEKKITDVRMERIEAEGISESAKHIISIIQSFCFEYSIDDCINMAFWFSGVDVDSLTEDEVFYIKNYNYYT